MYHNRNSSNISTYFQLVNDYNQGFRYQTVTNGHFVTLPYSNNFSGLIVPVRGNNNANYTISRGYTDIRVRNDVCIIK